MDIYRKGSVDVNYMHIQIYMCTRVYNQSICIHKWIYTLKCLVATVGTPSRQSVTD